jgi:hypothetical protein
MIAFGITGAGVVYLVLLALHGFGIIVSVNIVAPIMTGITLAALVFSAFFVDSLMVYMSESLYLYRENMLRAKRAEKALSEGEPVIENQEQVEDESYLESGIPINGGRDGYIIAHRPLTTAERLWGEYLETLALHAASRESYKTKALLGSVISQPDALTQAKKFLHEMGLIYNVNGDTNGARPIRSFSYVVEAIPDRLSRVKFPETPPPPIPPAPPETLGLLDKSRIKVKGQ